MLRITVDSSPTNELVSTSEGSFINIGAGSGDNNKMNMTNRFKTAKSRKTIQPKKPGTEFFSSKA